MEFYKPENLTDLLSRLQESTENRYFLAGGTDINVQIKNDIIDKGEVIYINHLKELNGISESEFEISIGATTTFFEILKSPIIKKYLPFFQNSLDYFASPILQTSATIGGNIANGSPTADVMPLLLILDAKLELKSAGNSRSISISDFFKGYKLHVMKPEEIIYRIIILKNAEEGYKTFYEKVGARKTLTIAKVALAGLKKESFEKISEIKLAVGSLNEYARRLPKMEEYLQGKAITEIDYNKVEEILNQEITPISDLRSDKEYRYHVCANLIRTFLNK
ncbi:MAG: xanthine dehydrogenase family protein subunit M [Candidatus Cloacimonetes bacterium]|nr:xanthine dehydrogenase family protein subunit M [Candidatus Cloacimonadota bacterium]MCF7814710.1 xanthine dehydrogenase family protein subunit M [Candidatus Cloacimonadota bacterium]MCF7868169.1 xanthine dehydrogenase family protein subunit M [Candidatus Cloacimonadota bacterium]MCF7884479.1 xanthine dehydrogenase family protein subunit M [Candidatus Cloacimonadota bacterium]